MYERLISKHDLIHSFVQQYYILASVVFLFYDLVTTLDIEIVTVLYGEGRSLHCPVHSNELSMC